MELLHALRDGVSAVASPCVLPLIPAVLALAAGLACLRRGSVLERARWGGLTALLAAAGFALLFAAEGATASAVAVAARNLKAPLQAGGGALLAAGGVALMAGWRRSVPPAALCGAAVLGGAALAAAWTPCIGPVLATALFQASMPETLHGGIGLLLTYAAGMFVPLVPLAAAAGALPAGPRRGAGRNGWAERITGAALAAAGVLLASGRLASLTARLAVFQSWLDLGA